MISDTTKMLLKIYSNSFLQKIVLFPHVRNFRLIYGPYINIIHVLFGLILMEYFVNFFKCWLNFRACALQLELNKVGYTNLRKFKLQNIEL